ncbi:MAG: phage tail protein [Anaerovibrio sp.]|uniref:phage tail-collar fiber domain-containing protein n=1 Tax=Anaerovibrio sp. TaxID=1872532 RepID=UPI0025D9371A|nr:phage tail protein [Anaerovibrio sp.]MCR5175687.1 phage tail protein [Anaerovibrio sp.]
MSQWAGGVLTAAGRALQAKVEIGATLSLTRIKLGDGTESMSAVDALTDLVSPKTVLGISSATAADGIATITGVMSASQLNAGFYCREWGLFAQDPDVGEILYMVTIDSNPEWLPASTQASQVSATYALKVAVTNASSITVNIDPAGLVDADTLAKASRLRQINTAYAAGAIVYDMQLSAHPDWRLECKVAGTSSSALLDLSSAVLGDTVSDGTVTWVIKRAYTTEGDFFEIDTNGGLMPAADPVYSVNFELDSNGDLMPKTI